MCKPELKVLACDYILGGLSCFYLVFAFLVVEYKLPYMPVCPLLLVTRKPCLLCGSTRMIGGYLHGILEVNWNGLPPFLWFAFVLSVIVVSIVRVFSYYSE